MKEIFKYIKTGQLYEVVQKAIMKNPITRKWEDCVIYRQHGTENPMTFVRNAEEFYNSGRFEKYEDKI